MNRYSDSHNHSHGSDSLFPYLKESAEAPEVPENNSHHQNPASLSPQKDRYTIGEVVSALQEEFPGLSVSKVRYLERRRLISLERTSGGYRLFSTTDVDLLRRILDLQENEYLPLEVIRQRIDSGIIPTDSHGRSPEWPVIEEAGKSYTREELARELEADSRFIEELISVGVIGRGDETGTLSGRDLEVARLATEMSRYSIQPRHLRGIVAAVDREVAMFKQVLNPDLRSGDEQKVSAAMDKARHLASVDSRLKELIMSGAIESMYRSSG